MTLPGLEVQTLDASTPRGAVLRLSTPFIVGELERGPNAAVAVRSLRDLQRLCGARTATSAPTHDWLDAYFHEGGGLAYVVPLRGPSAAAASHQFMDGAGSPAVAITVTAKEEGSWGNGATNGLSADIDVSGSNFEVKIYLDGVQVESSGMVADGAAAAAWSTTSQYVTITDGPGVDPVATGSPANLTGGDDDYDGITTAQITAAGALFLARYGAGTGVLPGRTDSDSQIALATALNAVYRSRVVKADLDTDTAANVATAAADLRADTNADVFDILVGRVTIPGLASGSTRTVPLSALRAGAEARNEALGISPNQAAAGRWGIAQWATALDHEWSETDRETLTDAGVNVAIIDDDGIKLFGARTAVDPDTDPAGIRLGSLRLRSAIVDIVRQEGGAINFEEIDPGGVALGNLRGRISGAIREYQSSLYFLDVDVYLVEDELNAGTYIVEVAIEFQASPDAERVRVVITRAVTQV